MIHDFVEDANFTDDMPFGEFIRKKRRLMGLNQTDFGKMLGGLSQGTISQWELRETTPYFDYAKKIVSALGGEILIVNKEETERYDY